MTKKTAVKKLLAWVCVIAAFFVLALGAIVLAVVVGDWVYIHTTDSHTSWLVGGFVLVACLVSMGIVAGLQAWLREPTQYTSTKTSPTEKLEVILQEVTHNRD